MKEEQASMLGLSPGLRDNPFPGLLLNPSVSMSGSGSSLAAKDNPFPGLLPGFPRALPGLPPTNGSGLSLPSHGPGQSPAIPNMWPFIWSHISNLLPQLSISRMDPLSQVFSLKWTQHTTNMFSVFERLLATEAFTDVTLACDGGSLKCHQIVLAASSDYFQKLFLDNNSEHPIVYLKDVKADQMRAILDYMYKGEVNVGQDDLPALLRVAEMLKIKGMIEDGKSKDVKEGVLPHPRSVSPANGGPPNSIVPPNGDVSSGSAPPRTPTSMVPGLPPGAIPPNFRPFLTPPGGSTTPPFPMWPGLPGLFPGAHNLFNRHDERKELSPGPRDRSKMSSGSSSDKEIPLPPLIPREGSEDRSDKSFKDDSEHGDKPMKMDGNIAGYVPAQRLEWKRYKQYTRNDIMAAIEEVRKGKSALQVSKKYNIPSRTLYDKVKKMGITTGRQQQRKQMNNSSSFNYSAAFPSLNMMSGINQLGGSDNIAIPDNPYKSIMERMKENREDDSRDSISDVDMKNSMTESAAAAMRKDLGPMPFSILPPHMLNMMERIKAEDKERELKEDSMRQEERENSPMNLSSEREADKSFPHSPSPGSTDLTTSPSNCQTSPTETARDSAGDRSPESAAAGQHNIDIRAQFLADLRRFGDTRRSVTSPDPASSRTSQDSLPPRKRKVSHEHETDPGAGKLNLQSERGPGAFNGLCESSDTTAAAAIVN